MLLNELLRQLANSRQLQTPETLAKKLDTTPEMVMQMMEYLVQQGYLTEDSSCVDSCTACPLQSRCGGGNNKRPRLWSLTEKGNHAVRP